MKRAVAKAEETISNIAPQNGAASAEPVGDKLSWRAVLHTVDQLAQGEPEWIIEGFAQEGITCFGSLAGVAKTWLALALSKALGPREQPDQPNKFLGLFDVPTPRPIIYLCPEMGAKAFRQRCEKLKIGGPTFWCMTIADGAALPLDSQILAAAIRELGSPVIVLDTAIRFSRAEDENNATQNKTGLSNAIFELIHLGAIAVFALHHATKASLKTDMTLESALRGSGELGAMPSTVWAIAHDRGNGLKGAAADAYFDKSRALGRCVVQCVKPRDFDPSHWKFRIQLRPFIDDKGKVVALTDDDGQQPQEMIPIAELLERDPTMTITQLAEALGTNRGYAERRAKDAGWERKDGVWGRFVVESKL